MNEYIAQLKNYINGVEREIGEFTDRRDNATSTREKKLLQKKSMKEPRS